jgi:hypothetical protein
MRYLWTVPTAEDVVQKNGMPHTNSVLAYGKKYGGDKKNFKIVKRLILYAVL